MKKKATSKAKIEIPSGTDAVEVYLAKSSHALLPELQALRAIVKQAGPRLEEGVKWNAPSFQSDGDDRLTFNLSAKDKVRLIFHTGAKKKAKGPKGRLISDPSGLLEWAADDRAIASFANMAEVRASKAALSHLVKAWLKASAPDPA